MDKLPTYCCIALLESCFFGCRMCYKWKSGVNVRDPNEPTIKQWENFIFSLRSFVKGKFQINFAGGEPLVREETLKLISYASKEGFDTILATNAYLIDEAMAKKISNAELSAIYISLDSLKPERHDNIRGKKGAFKRVMQAIDHIKDYADNVKINISTVIMHDNLDELGEIVKWVQKNDKINSMGFQALTQPFSTPEDDYWYKNEKYCDLWPADVSEIEKAIDKLLAMKQNGFNKLGNPLSQLCVYKAYFRNPNNFIKVKKCHIDTQAINITPNGEIRICFYMAPIGNIKSDNIRDVWFSQDAQDLRVKISGCKRNCQSMVNCNYDEAALYQILE